MKRAPPSLAVWCVRHLAGGGRGDALLGDLLERFHAGETRGWFWRQTFAAVAYSFLREAREHGTSFVGALAMASAVLLAEWIVDPFITRKVIHFQTHQLLEIDPHWTHHAGWQAAFLAFSIVQICVWFAAATLIAVRMHRAHPRLIITVFAIVVFALHLPLLSWQAGNLLTHPRYLDVFMWTCIHALLATDTVIWFGWWGARRTYQPTVSSVPPKLAGRPLK